MTLEGLSDLPSRMRELGRIRMGEKKKNAAGKTYPAPRTTWRFTSQAPWILEAVAEKYGGTVEEWPEAPGIGTFFQVGTEANAIEVLIPVGFSLSQYYEFWTADGCVRRCTGKVNLIDDTPCVCPADISARMDAASGVKPTACKPTTRLNVMLPDIPDLGFFRLECHGYQGAIELPGALAMYVGLARQHAGPDVDISNLIVKAELAIETRAVKKPGKPRQDFVVPIIRTPNLTPRMLMSGQEAMSLGAGGGSAQLGPGPAPALSPANGAASQGDDIADPADDWDRTELMARIDKLDEEHREIAKARWMEQAIPPPNSDRLTKDHVDVARSLLLKVEGEADTAYKNRQRMVRAKMKDVGVVSDEARNQLASSATDGRTESLARLSTADVTAIVDYCQAMLDAEAAEAAAAS